MSTQAVKLDRTPDALQEDIPMQSQHVNCEPTKQYPFMVYAWFVAGMRSAQSPHESRGRPVWTARDNFSGSRDGLAIQRMIDRWIGRDTDCKEMREHLNSQMSLMNRAGHSEL